MNDLLNFFCVTRLKDIMIPRTPSQIRPEILIPPPFSSSSNISSDLNTNFNLDNKINKTTPTPSNTSSIKMLLEKNYKKKRISNFLEENQKIFKYDELKPSELEALNISKPEKKQYLRNWSQIEDTALLNLFKKYGGKWDIIAKKMGKTANQCSHHWRKIKPKEMKIRRLWTKIEDDKLIKLVNIHGKDWNIIALEMPERNRKQIRDRYNNTLDPKIRKDEWTLKEDQKLLEFYQKYGPKWALISSNFEGRSEIMIKNRYNNHLKLKSGESAIETETHEGSEQDIDNNKESTMKANITQNNNMKMEEEEIKIGNKMDLGKYLEGLNTILNPNLLCSYGNQREGVHGKKSQNTSGVKKREKDHISFYPHDVKASSGSDTFNKSPHLYESEKSVLNSLKNINIQDEKSENEKRNMSVEYGSIEEVDEEIKKNSLFFIHVKK